MRKLLILLLLFTAALAFSFFTFPGALHNPHISYKDTLEEERLRYMNEVLESIKGKEKMNTDSVFKNIQTFKGVKNFKADHFLMMMNLGWSEGLGVSCTYCHIPGKWESDEKPEKQIARQMYGLRQLVNDKLGTMTGLKSTAPPLINCGTCHHGKPVPAE